MILLKPVDDSFPAGTFVIKTDGIYLRVGILVSKEMIPFLFANRVFKGKTNFVYSLEEKLTYNTEEFISITYYKLLKLCMIHARVAKQKVLSQEISQLTLF